MATANTLMLGQVYLALLLSMLWAFKLLLEKKETTPGILVGAGIAVKYFPLVFLPALIYLKKWKTILALFFTIIILNVAAWMIFGGKTYYDFFYSVFFQHLNGKLEGQSPWSPAFQSWNALAYNLFKYHPVENPQPFLQSDTLFYILQYGIIALILCITLWLFSVLKKRPHFVETSLVLSSITILFLSPAGATYHNLLFILPLTLIARISPSNNNTFGNPWMILVACTVLIGLLPLLQSRIPFYSSSLLLSFSRLWLNALIYFTISYWLLKFHADRSRELMHTL